MGGRFNRFGQFQERDVVGKCMAVVLWMDHHAFHSDISLCPVQSFTVVFAYINGSDAVRLEHILTQIKCSKGFFFWKTR